MGVAIILFAWVIQRFFKCYSRSLDWGVWRQYLHYMQPHALRFGGGKGWLTLLVLELPVILGVVVLVQGSSLLLGHVGVSLVELLALWFCLDIPSVAKLAAAQDGAVELSLVGVVEKVFAPIFWFFFFGVLGLVVYISVLCFSQEWQEKRPEETEEKSSEGLGEGSGKLEISTGVEGQLGRLLEQVREAMNWLPAQLLVFSVGLLQKPSAFFNIWIQGLRNRQAPYSVLGDWFKAIPTSLVAEKRVGMAGSRTGCVERSLGVWVGFFIVIRLLVLL
eukprot:TRINITY_DN15138_c0_g1_i12.p4 TRINITY_DN15138_c0_g1~~TRINITY_DN15138_c0_g1_i12.p4  ORF type:complete len:276 (+),score=-57.19 TRINITY_DN15138_c0_g1_i12:2360-3187(+)